MEDGSVSKVLAEEQAEPTWKTGMGAELGGWSGLAGQLAYPTWHTPTRDPVQCLRNGIQDCPLVPALTPA